MLITGGHAQRRSSARQWMARRTLGLPFSGGDSDAHLIPASCSSCKCQHGRGLLTPTALSERPRARAGQLRGDFPGQPGRQGAGGCAMRWPASSSRRLRAPAAPGRVAPGQPSPVDAPAIGANWTGPVPKGRCPGPGGLPAPGPGRLSHLAQIGAIRTLTKARRRGPAGAPSRRGRFRKATCSMSVTAPFHRNPT